MSRPNVALTESWICFLWRPISFRRRDIDEPLYVFELKHEMKPEFIVDAELFPWYREAPMQSCKIICLATMAG